jgi:hypothetical protein
VTEAPLIISLLQLSSLNQAIIPSIKLYAHSLGETLGVETNLSFFEDKILNEVSQVSCLKAPLSKVRNLNIDDALRPTSETFGSDKHRFLRRSPFSIFD